MSSAQACCRRWLYDLRTRTSTTAIPNGGRLPTLWGNYLAWVGPQNEIYRRDLARGRTILARGAGSQVFALAVHGDHIAWQNCYARCSIGYRNLATGSPTTAITLGTQWLDQHLELSGGFLTYLDQEYNGAAYVLKRVRLGTSAPVAIPGPSRLYDMFDESLAWIGASREDQLVRIAPLPAFVEQPRYLGAAYGASIFTPNGDGASDEWRPEFGISKPLPKCLVTIRSNDTVRRVLNCATAVGAARVSWDGRDSGGRALPKGTYSWALTGADADGPLLWWNGWRSPITGTVRIL